MKKTIIILLIISVALTYAGCGREDKIFSFTAQEAAEKIVNACSFELPSLTGYNPDPNDNTAFKYDFGIDPPEDISSAYGMSPKIGTIPFFIGIIILNDSKNAKETAIRIENGIDRNKLVCASYTVVKTSVNGNAIIVVCDTNPDRAKALVDAFNEI